MKYICPVCGYDALSEPPTSWNICPSCGTEFEYDNDAVSFQELRNHWVARGAKWWSLYDPVPPNWNPQEQLRRAGLSVPFYKGQPIETSVSRNSATIDLINGYYVSFQSQIRGQLVPANTLVGQVLA